MQDEELNQLRATVQELQRKLALMERTAPQVTSKGDDVPATLAPYQEQPASTKGLKRYKVQIKHLPERLVWAPSKELAVGEYQKLMGYTSTMHVAEVSEVRNAA